MIPQNISEREFQIYAGSLKILFARKNFNELFLIKKYYVL